MEIAESTVADVLVLEPVGAIDSTTANLFATKVTDIAKARDRNFIIDLDKIKYVSSAGVRALIMVAQAAERMQRKVVLCGLNSEVDRLFAISKMSELFVICASREEAAGLAK